MMNITNDDNYKILDGRPYKSDFLKLPYDLVGNKSTEINFSWKNRNKNVTTIVLLWVPSVIH